MALHDRLRRLRRQAEELPDIGGAPNTAWPLDAQLDDLLSRVNFHRSYGTVQECSDREISLLAAWSACQQHDEPTGEVLLEHSKAVVRWRESGELIYMSIHHDGTPATIEKLLADLPPEYRPHAKRMASHHQRAHELFLYTCWLESQMPGVGI